jgi:hypothetical protein
MLTFAQAALPRALESTKEGFAAGHVDLRIKSRSSFDHAF